MPRRTAVVALAVTAMMPLLVACGSGERASSGTGKSAAARQQFELNNGWILGLVVPEGWAARGYKTEYAVRGVILEPTADTHLEGDAQALTTGGSASGPHGITIESGTGCVGDNWKLTPVQTSSEGGVTVFGRRAEWTSHGTTCLSAGAGDREATARVSAVETLENLTKDSMITVRAATDTPTASR